MPSSIRWSEASLEERGHIRELIHRRLVSTTRHTDTAVMHACGLDIDTVHAALEALVKSGAVVIETDAKRTYYRGVPRKQ